jgi:chaperonin GroES
VAKVKKAAKKAAPKKPVSKTAAKKPAAKKASAQKMSSKTAAKKSAAQPAPKAAAKKVAPKKAAPAKSAAKPATKSSPKAENIKWDQFLTPLDDRLIIEISAGEKITAGGLIIPDTVTDTSGNYKGTVLIAGRGHRDEKGKLRPMDVKAGDTVLFSEFTGAKMNLMGKEVRILRETEIMGIVTKK